MLRDQPQVQSTSWDAFRSSLRRCTNDPNRARQRSDIAPSRLIASNDTDSRVGSPDLQEEAVKTVLAQAELLCAEWV